MRVPHDEIGFHDPAGCPDNIDELRLLQAGRCPSNNKRGSDDSTGEAKSGKRTKEMGTRE
jgi:hypothetical protein